MVAFFGSEENAPWTTRKFGSGYYAYQALQAGENIVAMIEADALAYNASRETPWIVEMHTRRPRRDKGGGDAAIASMWEDVIATYSIADLQPERYALGNRLSDHGSFWKWGYNAVLLLEEARAGSNPNWHQVTDTVYTFNWSYYEQVTKSLVGLAAHQAGITSP